MARKRKAPTRSSLLALDEALEYVRQRPDRILPPYVLGMVPFSGAMFFLLDAVASRHVGVLPFGCLLLTLATLWRWAWTAVAQRRVQQHLRGDPPSPLRPHLLDYLVIRLMASALITWGSLIILPAVYGIFLAGFAAPLLLEGEGRVLPKVRKTLGLINRSMGRLGKAGLALTMSGLLLLAGVMGMQSLLLGGILPSVLGLDASDLVLTMSSSHWLLCLFYFLFLVFDFYWTVASVMLFYDLRSQRLGGDLRRRLQLLQADG